MIPGNLGGVSGEKLGGLDCVGVPCMTKENRILVGDLSPHTITFRQLLPLSRMDLAVVSAARRWHVMICGAAILFAPKKWAVIELED